MSDTPLEPVSAAPAVDVAITDAAVTPIIPNPTASPAVETVTAPVIDATAPADAVTNATGSPDPTKTEVAAESPVENILGDAPAKEGEAKPVDAKADTEVKPTEGEPIPLPVYDDFTLPEGISIDKEQLLAFSGILGEIESGKLDHAGMQVAGQKLVDLAAKATQDSITRLNDYYVQFHENQKKTWFEAFKKDPELGNDNQDRMVEITGKLRGAINEYGGTEAQAQEFRALMKETGVGNHPALLRIMNNMITRISKYETESDNGNGGNNRIVPAARPVPTKVKDYEAFYN